MSLIDPAYLRFTNIAEFGLPGGPQNHQYDPNHAERRAGRQ